MATIKKSEILETLKNGGHIAINTVTRTARVYTADGAELGAARYDTAQNLCDAYPEIEYIPGGWSMIDRVIWAQPVEQPAAQPAMYTSVPEALAIYGQAAKQGVHVSVRDTVHGTEYSGPAWAVFDSIVLHDADQPDAEFAPVRACDVYAWATIEAAYEREEGRF